MIYWLYFNQSGTQIMKTLVLEFTDQEYAELLERARDLEHEKATDKQIENMLTSSIKEELLDGNLLDDIYNF